MFLPTVGSEARILHCIQAVIRAFAVMVTSQYSMQQQNTRPLERKWLFDTSYLTLPISEVIRNSLKFAAAGVSRYHYQISGANLHRTSAGLALVVLGVAGSLFAHPSGLLTVVNDRLIACIEQGILLLVWCGSS